VVFAWRIVKSRFASTAFDGEGARLYGGRWTSIGRRAVYTSSSIALATLEIVAHVGSTLTLAAYSFFEIGIPEPIIKSIDVGALPPTWREYPAPSELAGIGDTWLEQEEFAVLKVPSAIVGVDFNYLLNPLHRDFGLIAIGQEQPYRLDPRLI
jgi:RES domain-containing protein